MYDLCIIGGGITGLYLFMMLRELRPEWKVALLEKGPQPGGKLQTAYSGSENTQQVLYEKGPWRLSKHHKKLIALCKALKIPLEEFPPQKILWKDPPGRIQAYKPDTAIPKDSALSTFDVWLKETNLKTAEHRDALTGYPGITEMNSVINAYDAKKVYSEQEYLFIKTGFTSVIRALQKRCEGFGKLYLQHHVVDVERIDNGYKIKAKERHGHNSFTAKSFRATRVVLACPPSGWQDFSIAREFLRPLLNAVEPVALNHIYGRSTRPPTQQHLYSETELCQTISSVYKNDWFQISYSAGRIADFWNRFFLSHKNLFRKKLCGLLTAVTGVNTNLLEIKPYYWQEAVHAWKPSFGFQLDKMYKLGLLPDPIHLDGLMIMGEAFSKNQGWCEGALETVDDGLPFLLGEQRLTPLVALPDLRVFYRGRILDVTDWIHSHPGGYEALKNHLGEEIGDLWDSIHGAPFSWVLIASLQVGWVSVSGGKRFALV
jgi:hypothetical protein